MTTGKCCKSRAFGFTLLESVAACAALMLIVTMAMGMINSVSDLWIKQRNKSVAFEGAAAACEVVTRSLAQATLNTYWGYVIDEESHPVAYRRESELHFQMARSAGLLNAADAQYPGMGVFFQAPEGRASSNDLKRLPALLNGIGFFTVFSAQPRVPSIFQPIIPPRYRFRLMEWQEPVEQLEVYKSAAGNSWFSSRVIAADGTLRNTAILAENIVALILMAEYPEEDGKQTRSFVYDSRNEGFPERLNQLPPRVHVLMMAISEASAIRLAEKYGTSPPPLLPQETLFQTASEFEKDIEKWEEDLRKITPPVDYQIFNSVVNIKSAKWSK